MVQAHKNMSGKIEGVEMSLDGVGYIQGIKCKAGRGRDTYSPGLVRITDTQAAAERHIRIRRSVIKMWGNIYAGLQSITV